MSEKTLYLAWQDKARSRRWFPIGRLDAAVECPQYRFRYIRGAKQAREKAGFPLLIEFPKLEEDYRSPELFPVFQNRVMNRKRPDFTDYLRSLDLAPKAGPIEILSANGGRRMTDTYEVFPKLVKRADGSFTCRFFLHGWQHVNASAQRRIDQLAKGEELYVTLELTNPVSTMAVQIQTKDDHMVGWAPHYLVVDLVKAMAESPKYSAQVVRVNPQRAPSKQRVLIQMRGSWDEHEPMSGPEFRPLVS